MQRMLTFLMLFAFFGDALAGDNVWTSIGPYTSWVVDAVVVDPSNPQTVYVSSLNSGLWKSADGGTSWGYIGEGLPGGYIRDVAIDPSDAQTLYVGVFGGVYKTTSGGASWQKASQGMPANTYVFYLTMDPSNPRTIYAQSSTGALFKTADGGASWTQIHPGKASFYKTLAIDSRNPRVLYFASAPTPGKNDAGIYKSADGGASWTMIQEGIDASSLVIDPTSSQTLYAGASGGVYRSVDGGASWTRTHSDTLYVGAQRMTIRFLRIDPSSPQVIYAGAPNAIYKSANGGTAWAELSGLSSAQKRAYVGSTWTPDISLGGLAMPASSPQTLYAGLSFDGAYKSVDGGNTWTKLRWGVNAPSVLARAPSRSGTLYTSGFSTSGSFLYRTEDGGASWTVIPSIGPSACAVDPSNLQIVYASSGSRGMFKSTDGGASWTYINSGLPTSSERYVNALAIDPSNPQTVYASCISSSNRPGVAEVYRTTDGGASWQSLSAGLPANRRIYALVIDPSRTQTLYAGFDSLGVYRTTDGGMSWTSVNAGIPANTTVRAFAFDPSQTQTLYAGTSSGVYKTADGGASWTPASAGLPPNTVASALAVDPFRPQTVYAGTSSGVYKTADGGASWTSFSAGLPVKSIISLVLDPSEQKLYAGASPGGVYVIQSADIGGRLLGDFDGSGVVNFDDFFLFAAAFGQRATGDGAKFDLDGSGEVGLSDFFLFADRFGQRAQ